jgi:RNA polymerase sigma-B factor
MAAISSKSATAAEPARVLLAPAGEIRQDLAGLDDLELLGMVRALPPSSERRAAACDLLVGRYRALVRSCVNQYSRGPERAEDLMQVGYVGLLKAINNFDPAFGCGLAGYARPCIIGEIKRHFREKRWQVHVQRSLHDLVLEVREATRHLAQQLGHMPADAELASHLGVRDADIRDARRAELMLQPVSLDEPLGGGAGADRLADVLGQEDPRMEHMLGMQAVATHWGELPARERQILVLRFYGGMTQAQVGQQLGLSQMHVSWLLAHALGYLRPRLLGLPECASDVVRPAVVPIDLNGAAGYRRRASDVPAAGAAPAVSPDGLQAGAS